MLSFSESNPYYPLSNYHQSPSFTTQESKTFSQQHHHQNLFHGSNPSISVTPPNYMGYLSDINTNLSSKRGVVKKKDRHTKISTAQGVRDRRVRLSISIAREFFNLQDMLGFDKASKTLGWLLGKSKAAIDELATIDRNINEVENEKEVINLSAKTIWKKKSSSICKTDTRDIRREKARERARERTRKKMMIFNLNRQMGNLPDQHHQRAQLNSMICQSSSSASSKGISVGESVVVKSKMRGSCYNYNHEMIMRSNDYQESCNYYNDYLTWFGLEINGGIIRQPGIHINAKQWDT